MVDVKNLTIKKTQELLLKKEFSVLDLIKSYKEIVNEKNTLIHAFLETFDDVESLAQDAQKAIDSGNILPLTGIPIALKDNILVKGKHVSAGSHILEHFTAPYDSTASEAVKKAGGIFIGRTNMDEFAMGVSTENSAFGVTRNPYDPSRVPGGSSGGAAAAVAMHGALAALGSDTGGSVRQPASFCGCVGLKPTYGAVSRFGLIAMASSLDQIGPITQSVDDAEILFNVIKGTDPLDSTSFYPKEKKTIKEKLTIGVPRHFLDGGGIDPQVLKNFDESVEKLKKLGYEVVDITLPNIKYALSVYYIIVPAEVSSNLARFDGVKYGLHHNGEKLVDDYFITRGMGFGKEVRRRIILGTYVLSSGYYDAYYTKANQAAGLIKKDYDDAFKKVDIIVTPTTPAPAFKIGEKVNDPLQMYLEDIFTGPVNVSGNPAISLPGGFADVQGVKLPLGFQMIADKYREDILFKAGKDFLGESEVR